jgi:hypothetical protein
MYFILKKKMLFQFMTEPLYFANDFTADFSKRKSHNNYIKLFELYEKLKSDKGTNIGRYGFTVYFKYG